MAKVIRLWGKADSFDIEFTENGDKWTVDIPPDMTDGVYAVQLTAVDENGNEAYWVGELYMVDGVCCLKLNEIPYKVRLRAKEFDTKCDKQRHIKLCLSSQYTVEFSNKSSIQIKLKDRCTSAYITEIAKRLSVCEFDCPLHLQIERSKANISKKRSFDTEYTTQLTMLIGKGCCNARH